MQQPAGEWNSGRGPSVTAIAVRIAKGLSAPDWVEIDHRKPYKSWASIHRKALNATTAKAIYQALYKREVGQVNSGWNDKSVAVYSREEMIKVMLVYERAEQMRAQELDSPTNHHQPPIHHSLDG